jgi:hypothetical protein
MARICQGWACSIAPPGPDWAGTDRRFGMKWRDYMTRYQYVTVPMTLDNDKGFVRWQKGSPESSLREVLAEYADKGWRYINYVPINFSGSRPLGDVVFDREIP